MTFEETPKIKHRIKSKILSALLGLSLLTMILFSILSLVNIYNLGKYSIDSSSKLGDEAIHDSFEAMNDQTRRYLSQLVQDQSDISSHHLYKVENEVHIMTAYAEELLSNPNQGKPCSIYSDKHEPPDKSVVCAYKLSPGVSLSSVRKEIKLLNHMTEIFVPITENDGNIDSIYIGTVSGVILSYPWMTGFDDSYDPRKRDWYKAAVKHNSGIWTDPYIHAATKELIVTYAKPFYDGLGNLAGVLEVDVTMNVMNEKIVSTQVGQKGYALLIDKNGKVIVRPDLEANDTRWDETYKTENLLESDNLQLRSIIKQMINGETGVSKCTLDDGDKYMAYAPIRNTSWSLCIVMPLEDIMKPLIQTQKKIITQTRQSEEYIAMKRTGIAYTFIIIAIVLLILVTLSALSISNKITSPILALNEGANVVGEGNLDFQLNIRTGDEIEQLANTFNKMTQDLKIYISDLKQTTAEKERIESDLRIATEIQTSMLPTIFPAFPDRTEFDIFASMEPAKEVGGDFYDFFFVSENHLCFVIGDVSGKGVPAALFMVITKTLLKTEASRGIPPEYVLFNVNNTLVPENETCMFATVFIGLLDIKTGELQYANAGHNPPIISRKTGETAYLDVEHGFVLGTFPDSKFGSGSLTLSEDDLLFLYTDGVTEAIDEEQKLFSEPRLRDILEKVRDHSTQEIIGEVRKEINFFVKLAPQYDDITMLTLKLNKKPE